MPGAGLTLTDENIESQAGRQSQQRENYFRQELNKVRIVETDFAKEDSLNQAQIVNATAGASSEVLQEAEPTDTADHNVVQESQDRAMPHFGMENQTLTNE